MFKKSLYYLLILSFFLIIVEFISLGLSKLNLLKFNNSPYIYSDKKYINLDQYWTEEESWGAWHKKNITVKHKKSCFDVEYQTNDIGARDDNFKNQKYKKNMILIGDSFVEGDCVKAEESLNGNISELTGNKIITLGIGGSGPLFYLARIREYANRLKPKKIIWFHYEGNDIRNLYYEKQSSILLNYLS